MGASRWPLNQIPFALLPGTSEIVAAPSGCGDCTRMNVVANGPVKVTIKRGGQADIVVSVGRSASFSFYGSSFSIAVESLSTLPLAGLITLADRQTLEPGSGTVEDVGTGTGTAQLVAAEPPPYAVRARLDIETLTAAPNSSIEFGTPGGVTKRCAYQNQPPDGLVLGMNSVVNVLVPAGVGWVVTWTLDTT